MRKVLLTGLLALGLSVGAALPAAASADTYQVRDGRAQAARSLQVVGLTDDGKLTSFRADRPNRVNVIDRVSGLRGDRFLVGIDFRVQDGKLYGVGNRGGIYTINTRNARAHKVSQLTVPLQGRSFGVDFNPPANRLRVISDTGQNLRHNIDDRNGMPARGQTAVDGTLTIPPATNAALGVTAAAYTNNDLASSTATSLFDLDTTNDTVVLQSPANAGSLAPTGMLGTDTGSRAGFDIYSSLRRGVTVDNTGLATLQVGGKQRLYQVNLLTGAAGKIGDFPSNRQVVDLAVPLNQG